MLDCEASEMGANESCGIMLDEGGSNDVGAESKLEKEVSSEEADLDVSRLMLDDGAKVIADESACCWETTLSKDNTTESADNAEANEDTGL